MTSLYKSRLPFGERREPEGQSLAPQLEIGFEASLLLLGQTTQALRRYQRLLEDLRPEDSFFVSRCGGQITRKSAHEVVAKYRKAAGIEGVRCSPHTLRHTGAKRFILADGDVFTLQKLLGHTTLYMVRRYVEMASIDAQARHDRYSPADSLLRRRVVPDS